MVQWQNATFPRLRYGFDSRYPLKNCWAIFALRSFGDVSQKNGKILYMNYHERLPSMNAEEAKRQKIYWHSTYEEPVSEEELKQLPLAYKEQLNYVGEFTQKEWEEFVAHSTTISESGEKILRIQGTPIDPATGKPQLEDQI